MSVSAVTLSSSAVTLKQCIEIIYIESNIKCLIKCLKSLLRVIIVLVVCVSNDLYIYDLITYKNHKDISYCI